MIPRNKQIPQGGLAPNPTSPNYSLCQFPHCDVAWQCYPSVQMPNAGKCPTHVNVICQLIRVTLAEKEEEEEEENFSFYFPPVLHTYDVKID